MDTISVGEVCQRWRDMKAILTHLIWLYSDPFTFFSLYCVVVNYKNVHQSTLNNPKWQSENILQMY